MKSELPSTFQLTVVRACGRYNTLIDAMFQNHPVVAKDPCICCFLQEADAVDAYAHKLIQEVWEVVGVLAALITSWIPVTMTVLSGQRILEKSELSCTHFN